MSKNNLYLSIDVEADGPCAGINNLLTMGIALFNEDGLLMDQFYGKLKIWDDIGNRILEDLKPNPKTIVWWENQDSNAYAEAFLNPSRSDPDRAMVVLAAWLEKRQRDFNGIFIPIARPAAFHFPFLNYYFYKFLGYNPLGETCLDIRSYFHGVFKNKNYYDASKEEINKINSGLDSTKFREHFAVDNAIYYGELYFRIKHIESSTQK